MTGDECREEISWAAGLFEGEGSITPRGDVRSCQLWTIGMTMTDLDVVQRFQAAIGMGRIYGPYTPKMPPQRPGKEPWGERKVIYRWTISRNREVLEFCRLMRGRFCSRRSAKLALCERDMLASKAWVESHRKPGNRQPGQAIVLRPCACGCGETLPDFDSRGRPRIYIKTHFRRLPKF